MIGKALSCSSEVGKKTQTNPEKRPR